MSLIEKFRPRDRSEWSFLLGAVLGAPVVSIIARFITADGPVSPGRALLGAVVAAAISAVLAALLLAAFRYADGRDDRQTPGRQP